MMNREVFVNAVKQRLSAHVPTKIECQIKPKAAVLVAIVQKPEPQILLTLRAGHLKSHPGQVSFPGGMMELADEGSVVRAALRETEEEIALPADRFTILGELSTATSKDGVLVYPVVAAIESVSGSVASPSEIADIFTVPWQFFVDEQPRFEALNRNGQTVDVPHYYFEGRHIWGLTAMIILDLLKVTEKPSWLLSKS